MSSLTVTVGQEVGKVLLLLRRELFITGPESHLEVQLDLGVRKLTRHCP